MDSLKNFAIPTYRPALLFATGIAAGLIEAAALAGFSSVDLPELYARAGFAAVLVLGLAWDQGISSKRIQRIVVWGAVLGVGEALLAQVSAGAARLLLGAGIGIALAAPGPFYPVPWSPALRGAVGALAGAFLGNLLTSLGLPLLFAPGIFAVTLGILLAKSRIERFRYGLECELEAIRQRGTDIEMERGKRLVTIATRAMEEIATHEESSGENLDERREEVHRLSRDALVFLRRACGLGNEHPEVHESVNHRLTKAEESLETLWLNEILS